MIEVGGWLLVIGLCDLVRAARDATSWSRRLIMAGLGVCLLLLHVLALDLSAARFVLLLAVEVATFLLWLLGSAAALAGGGTLARAAAFTGLGGGVGLLVLGSGLAPGVEATLPGALGQRPVEDLVLLAGVVLAQLATANVVVRLLLDAVGVPAADNERTLKGGRMLGPMERLFIVGLGVAGQLTAASIVVAAKGLLRFPELQRGAREGGPRRSPSTSSSAPSPAGCSPWAASPSSPSAGDPLAGDPWGEDWTGEA